MIIFISIYHVNAYEKIIIHTMTGVSMIYLYLRRIIYKIKHTYNYAYALETRLIRKNLTRNWCDFYVVSYDTEEF